METGKTKNKKWIIIIAAIGAVVCIAVAAVILVTGNSTERKLTEQLDQAEGYLSELDYESAIVAYEAAIEIDPGCRDAYLGLADIYIEQEEYEEAAEILEEGLAQTDSRAIMKKLEDVEELLAERENLAEEIILSREDSAEESLLPEEEEESSKDISESEPWVEADDGDVYIVDNIGVIDNEDSLKEVMREFEDLTGIYPCVMTVYDSDWNQDYEELWQYAYDVYINTYSDELHFLIVYSEPENAAELDFVDWSWEAIQGDDTDPILTEYNFGIFQDALQTDLLRDNVSVGEAFENAFEKILQYLNYLYSV